MKKDARNMRYWVFDYYERTGHEVRLIFSKGRVRRIVRMDLGAFREAVNAARHSEDYTIKQATEARNTLGDAR